MNFLYMNRPYVEIGAFYALSLQEYRMAPHRHPRYEIMYVTKGVCHIQIDERDYRLGEHQFIILREDLAHGMFIPDGQTCWILNLEFSCHREQTPIDLRELFRESRSFARLCRSEQGFFIGSDTGDLGYALKDLVTQLGRHLPLKYNTQMTAPPSDPEHQYLIRLLFLRAMLELSGALTDDLRATGITYLKKACDYIDAHLTEKLRIPQLAEYAGVNKSYLQSLFARHLHCTIVDYINQKRLERAAFLLINSSLSITEIAFQSGYNSRQHFGSTFEKYYGLSPRSYRQLRGRQREADTKTIYYYMEEKGAWGNSPPGK